MKNDQIKLFQIAGLCFVLILLTATVTQKESASAQNEETLYLPIFINQKQPETATSYYMITVDGEFLFDLGCELGTRDASLAGVQDSVVVLDFSYPICGSGVQFGAELFGFGPVDLDTIGAAVENFGLGYYQCTASDNLSQLVIGIGTNNKPYSCDNLTEATAHGTAWATMVNTVNETFFNTGTFHQVHAYGASDMEIGWNGPAWTRAWIDGYDTVNGYPMLHFGDAAGCPYEDRPYLSCGSPDYPEWETEDLWYVSWGASPSLPLPLIYLTNGIHAKQWAFLSQYSVAEHGARVDFTGVFTQSQACEQWGCNDTDNTPAEAYQQMMAELSKYPETAQDLRWKTDIRWLLREEVP